MTSEYLLDAMGLLDDDLIREAERYADQKPAVHYGRWIAMAACLALVLTLGYGMTHIQMGGGALNQASGNAPSASSSGGTTAESNGSSGGDGLPSEQEPQDPTAPVDSSASNQEDPSGDWLAAIMVDGVVYWSTGTPVSAEVGESAIQTVTSYTNTQPEEDGQTNFDRSLTTQYAMTDDGLLVQINGAWILFDPVPPWEK